MQQHKIKKVVFAPAHLAEHLICKAFPNAKKRKKAIHAAVGVVLIIVGSTMASYSHNLPVNPVATDAVAYSIHGFGCAPIFRIVFEWLGLEY